MSIFSREKMSQSFDTYCPPHILATLSVFNTHLHSLLLRLYDEVVVPEDARPHQVPKLLTLLPKLLALVELGLRLQASWEIFKLSCVIGPLGEGLHLWAALSPTNS